MATNNGKEGANRRQAEADAMLEKLTRLGRVAWFTDYARNVRTHVWLKPRDRKVPVLIEQMRTYSSMDKAGTSRGMESSDMQFVQAGIDAAEAFIRHCKLPFLQPKQRFSEEQLLAAIDRGDNPPMKVVTCGNVAAALWSNKLGEHDQVFKTELFVLHPAPYGLDRFFFAGQIPHVRQCYLMVDEIIDQKFARMRAESLAGMRPHGLQQS